MTTVNDVRWDGFDAAALAARLGVPGLELRAAVESTQDVAHALAQAGAPAGTVVLADAQHAGRGRHGRSWSSAPGQGVWCTVVERPSDARALDVLSLRVGLHLARGLDALAGERVMIKWPNDLVLAAGKVAGILAEARWSGQQPSWVAVGVGVNVVRPQVAGAAGLPPAAERVQVLRTVVGAVRAAAAQRGWLSVDELRRYRERDLLAGRRLAAPAAGIAEGITTSGALVVRTERGIEEHRAGTIQLVEGS